MMYKCGVCGKAHETIGARAECELKCLKQKEQEEKALAAKKKAEEQAARLKEVNMAIDAAYALLDKYVKDYGEFRYNGDIDLKALDIIPTKLLSYFLF